MARKDRKFERRKSDIHGNGVFATELIRKGERLIRYKGKLRSHAEVDEKYGEHDEDGHTFLFTLNDDYVIDGNQDGNIARWINHSCAPNCEAVLEENAKGKRHKDKVFIEAIRDIEPGEELSYNYGIVLDEPYTPELKALWGCRCGAPGCTGTMLQPKAGKKRANADSQQAADKTGQPVGTSSQKPARKKSGTKTTEAVAGVQPSAKAVPDKAGRKTGTKTSGVRKKAAPAKRGAKQTSGTPREPANKKSAGRASGTRKQAARSR